MVDVLEREGRGLNLNQPVREGILKHTGPVKSRSFEGQIVRLVDRVAYINHDIDDALRAGILSSEDLPNGRFHQDARPDRRQPIDPLVKDIVNQSRDAGEIVQSEHMGMAMLRLRFMFDNVYLGGEAWRSRPGSRGNPGPLRTLSGADRGGAGA